MLLSPLPRTAPAPSRASSTVAARPQPLQSSISRLPPSSSSRTDLGRTPSFTRVSSHLPTRANRPISSYAPSNIPPVPHLPESVRPVARSMSTRRPGLESLPERASTLNRSVSQATPSTRMVRPTSSRYDGLSSGGEGAGAVGVGAMTRGPPPPGPPPREPLPVLPEPTTTRTPMPRRQSSLVSQRMSQLMGNVGGEGSSNGEFTSNRVFLRPDFFLSLKLALSSFLLSRQQQHFTSSIARSFEPDSVAMGLAALACSLSCRLLFVLLSLLPRSLLDTRVRSFSIS